MINDILERISNEKKKAVSMSHKIKSTKVKNNVNKDNEKQTD